jgi:hypothetical protein
MDQSNKFSVHMRVQIGNNSQPNYDVQCCDAHYFGKFVTKHNVIHFALVDRWELAEPAVDNTIFHRLKPQPNTQPTFILLQDICAPVVEMGGVVCHFAEQSFIQFRNVLAGDLYGDDSVDQTAEGQT